MAKNLLYLSALMMYTIGFVGGIGYTLWISEYVIAFGIAVLGVMAYPSARKMFNHFNSDEP